MSQVKVGFEKTNAHGVADNFCRTPSYRRWGGRCQVEKFQRCRKNNFDTLDGKKNNRNLKLRSQVGFLHLGRDLPLRADLRDLGGVAGESG